MEIQDLLQWLENADLRLSSSKTMWGMPDSASERLNAHLVYLNLAFVLTEHQDHQVSNQHNKSCPSVFRLPKGIVQWDGLKASYVHGCEERHQQDAWEQRCGPWLQHWAQLVYPRAEVDICSQQNPGAEGHWFFLLMLFHFYSNAGKSEEQLLKWEM